MQQTIESQKPKLNNGSKLNIYSKLQKCRVELQEMKLKKSGENAFAKFKYYELADFLPQVNDLFDKYNLFSNFSIREGIAFLKVVNTEKLDEIETFESPIENVELKGCTAIQGLGAVHTYMKRYLYLNALEIVEADVLDPNVGSDKIPTKKTGVKKHKQDTEFATYKQKEEYRTLVTPAEYANVMNSNGGRLPLAEYERVKNV
jgi:hypothetical protein